MDIIEDVKETLTAPLFGRLDIAHLFLLVGLVLVFSTAWVMILAHIRAAAMETL